ncbi:MAG: sacsin N-terminal ATP-binding-like domain-containing protein [Sedimentisphaerales bacterium]
MSMEVRLMPTDYDKIRADNILEYGQGTRHLSFLGRLYTDRTHFIFELLQNAEDAGATRILFRLFDNRLEVNHNGRLFDERDVRGICGVGEGTKSEDLTQIGKFGIGFKSVYAYTTNPEIHSGNEGFKIENYVRPHAVQSRLLGNSWTTLFVFPFNVKETNPETACREIGTRLKNLSARTLLFLRKIKEIEYKLPDLTGGVYLREEVVRGTARQVSVIGQNNGKDEEESWLIFERPVSVPEKTEDVRVEVSFRLKTEDKTGRKEDRIIKVKDSPLVVYFPTEKATRFGFLIQGPYRTTPSRDNVPKADNWNENLVSETAHLLTELMPQIKQLGLLTVSFLEALPIRADDFPEDSMFYPIVVAIQETLRGEDLLMADDGSFVSARNAKLARGADLRKLLNQEQLRILFQSTEPIKWLAGEITQDRTPDLRTYLMNELDVEEITPEGFSRKITHPFLSNQTDEWFVEFYGYLSGQEALWRAPRWDLGGPLRTKPILRLHDGSQESPFRSDGTTPNAFLPPPEDTDFPVVKRSIVKNEQSKSFLIRLGLSEPDVYDDIVERIIPKYANAEAAILIPTSQYIIDIKQIIRALSSDSESGKKKVIAVAKQTPLIRASDCNKNEIFKKPTEVYFDSKELRSYFIGQPNKWFISPNISELADPALHMLGMNQEPIIISTDKQGYSEISTEYSRWAPTFVNYELDGLEAFLKHLEILSFDEARERAFILWTFLKSYLSASGRNYFRAEYKWHHYSWKSKGMDSSFLVLLKKKPWIPTQNCKIECPGEITTDMLFEEFLEANELIERLGIPQGDNKDDLTEDERKREHAIELGVSLEDIEFLKNHSNEFERLKATIATRKERPTFPTRPVANPERRQERLGEQISDAPEKEYENRERSVRTTNGAIDPITWLRNQYTNESSQMVCQICKEEMPFRKRNGDHYFEKKEVLSKRYLPKEHEAQYLALCPLCAAMYEEYVKNDEDAMADLKDKLVSADDCDVPLTLGDVETSIRFVETHYHDLKVIIEETALS